jgi:hypothetical protein
VGEENLLAKIVLITGEYLSNVIITDGNDGRTGIKVRAMSSVVLSSLMKTNTTESETLTV